MALLLVIDTKSLFDARLISYSFGCTIISLLSLNLCAVSLITANAVGRIDSKISSILSIIFFSRLSILLYRFSFSLEVILSTVDFSLSCVISFLSALTKSLILTFRSLVFCDSFNFSSVLR